MNDRQELVEALKKATDNGVLDDLASYIHPDLINTFCEAAEALAKDGISP